MIHISAIKSEQLELILKFIGRFVIQAVAIMLLAPAGFSQVIQTIAGLGPVNIPGPQVGVGYTRSMALDGSGNLFFISGESVYRLSAAGTVSRYAGVSQLYYGATNANNLPALSALIAPTALAVDSAGNLYISNYSSILKVTAATGIITTIAGGSWGFSGDGGPAASASFTQLTGMAFDGSGNLYVADVYNQRIRMIAAGTGIVTTIAGNGASGYTGDGQAATSASLNLSYFTGLAFDSSGSLYITDTGNSRIRKVTQGIITTYAGNGSSQSSGDGGPSELAGFSYPSSVAVDSFGNLFVPDGTRVRKIAAGTRMTSTIAGSSNNNYGFSGDGGNASAALFSYVGSVVSDLAGNIYVSDQGNSRIRKISASGIVTTVAGNGTVDLGPNNVAATNVPLTNATSCAVDSGGNLYIADSSSVRKISIVQGTISTVAGNGSNFTVDPNGQVATAVGLDFINAVTVGPGGALYILTGARVVRVDPVTGVMTTVVNAANVYGYSGDGGSALAAALAPSGNIAFDGAGNLYIADFGNARVRMVSAATGIISTVAGNGVSASTGDNGLAINASFNPNPNGGIAVDSTGNIYIADSDVVRKVAAKTGIITTYAGNGGFGYSSYSGPVSPTDSGLWINGLAVDPSGTLYIADGDGFVLKVANGLLSAVAGGGGYYYSGDGGPARAAGRDPFGLAVDGSGNMYFTEDYGPVRMVSNPAGETTIVANSPVVSLVVDGVSYYGSPLSFLWTSGSTHSISAQSAYGSNARYAFSSWSDGGAATHNITAQSGGGTYTANYNTGYYINLNTSPGYAGQFSVSPSSSDGYYNAGTVQVTAVAYTGYKFTSFSGDVSSTSDPYSFNLTGPVSVTANFTCNPSLSSATATSTSAGGTLSIALTTGSGCSYTAVSNSSWITVGGSSSGSGTGSGTISVTVAANTGSARSGTVTIAGLTLTVSQSAPSKISVSSGSGQSASLTTAFLQPLVALVTDLSGTPQAGAQVIFSAPSSGPSGTFAGASNSVALTNAQGLATSPVFTSNSKGGSYSVTASTDTVHTTFSLSNGASQTITFGALGNVSYGTGPFTISATASSGLAVTFTSNTTAVCTVSGNTVTIVSAGGCSVTATQSGNATFAAAVPVTQSFAAGFLDVKPTDYYFNAINLLAQRGISTGCGSNNFCPTQNITRSQMAIFLVRAIEGGDTFTYSSTPHFADVPANAPGFQWIQHMYELGITTGCGNGNYCPNDNVTRDQMAVFIIRARYGAQAAFTYPTTPTFSDVPSSETYFQWIQRLAQDGITAGCGSGTYCPGAPVLRGDMAIFLMRGAFNQLLPPSTPVVTQISPATLSPGASGTFTVTGSNTHFVQGTTTLSPIPGITIGPITVSGAASMTVQLTAASNAVTQLYSLVAITGTEQAVLPNGLRIQ